MKKLKKIGLYLTSDGFGGLELVTVNFGKWMKERGWEVNFYITRNSRSHRAAESAGLNCFFINRPNKYFDLRNAYLLANELRKHGISQLFIFDNHDLSTANFVKKFFNQGLQMIYFQQMQFKVKKTSPAHTFRFSGLKYWISPLESLKKQVMRTTKMNPKKIVVIPFGLETERFLQNPYKKDEARKLLDLPDKGEIIGVLGRISPTKGQKEVVKSFLELAKTDKESHLLIMGEPTINEEICTIYNAEMLDLADNSEYRDRIHFRPFREEVELFYAAIDIFIMPSKKETYGLVTIEAMLSGKPVIGTNSGGTSEILNHGEYGQLFEFKNMEDLKDKIQNILFEKFNYSKMVQEAKTHAANTYSKEMMCERIEALLE